VAARYSDLDLNDHPGVIGQSLPADGIRGGDQRIWTAGLNWYPNNALKFELQFQNVQVSRIGTFQSVPNSSVGQTYDTIALRSQISF
jgi:phosphate-selective porin OprO/OprP